MDRAEAFEEHRGRLFGIAYRMLGSAADAEDVVQDAFLRWLAVGDETIESPGAYLSTIVTRLSIDVLRSARVRREEYVGPWLPEPMLTDGLRDASSNVALADSLSMAFLVLLESLGPVERAAFLLREVFEYEYDEIADILEKSEAACRQIVKRAKEHIAERRPRFEPSLERRNALTSEFLRAIASGDMNGLLGVFAEDITFWSDGGGKVRAALNPVHGADRVARLLLGLVSKAPEDFSSEPAIINGEPGTVMYIGGATYATMTLHIGPRGIEQIYLVVNPDKLGALRSSRG